MDDLRIIVKRLNEIFKADYNLSTFDCIAGSNLLKVTLRLLNEMGICQNTDNKMAPSLHILQVLELIKYTPSTAITPEAFREGLAEGSKKIVHPILLFLVRNEANVKKRYYLSKYVVKTDVPKEFLQNDTKMQNLFEAYSKAIDKFWAVYSENRKESSFAQEAMELEDDICQMKHDLANLERRIDVQSQKVEFSDFLLKITKSLLQETKTHDKLTKQLETDKCGMNGMIEVIRNFNHRDKITKLEDLIEKSEHYASSQQIYKNTINELTVELDIIEGVVRGSEPFMDDLQHLEEEQTKLQLEVNALNRSKQQDDTIEAFQNQQKILSKKKQQLSKQIIKIRLNNEQMFTKIEEVRKILGGDILRGMNFKVYIAELKALSNEYKMKKSELKAMDHEIEILKRTLSIIYNLEPNLESNIKNSSDNIPDDIKNLSISEVRTKTLKLKKEYDVRLKECFEDENKYQKIKDIFSDNLIQFDNTKHAFNEQTEFLPDCVDCLESELKKLENLILIEKEDLKIQEQGSEKLQDDLFRYSQMYIDNAGNLSTPEVLGLKLQQAQKTLDELRAQFDLKQQETYAQEQEKKSIKNIVLLIKAGKQNL